MSDFEPTSGYSKNRTSTVFENSDGDSQRGEFTFGLSDEWTVEQFDADKTSVVAKKGSDEQRAVVVWNLNGSGGGSSINVINSLNSTSTDDALSANMGRILNEKIAGNIPAIVANDYEALVDILNDMEKSEVGVGMNLYIKKKDVPDLWVSEVGDTSVTYTYTTDEQFLADLKAGSLKIGYTRPSELETSKPDLSNVVQDVKINGTSIVTDNVANIPVASNSLGVVKTTLNGNGGLSINGEGSMYIVPSTNAELEAKTQGSKPIVPSNLDKAVMEGLGNNSLTWSAAYKTSAQTTIGINTEQFVFVMADGTEVSKNIKVSA